MLTRFLQQFSGPRGPLGHLAGFLMSRMNEPLNRWVVDLLDVQANDRVLEVGFGPGLAVQLCAGRATAGRVAGIERSQVMLAQATRRNQLAIAAGRVDLRLGSAENLPFPSAAFSKACAVNSLQFWPSAADGIGELSRVLAPAGRLVLALRMRRDDVGRYNRSRFGFSEERADEVKRLLESAHFAASAVRREVRGETITALVGERLA